MTAGWEESTLREIQASTDLSVTSPSAVFDPGWNAESLMGAPGMQTILRGWKRVTSSSDEARGIDSQP